MSTATAPALEKVAENVEPAVEAISAEAAPAIPADLQEILAQLSEQKAAPVAENMAENAVSELAETPVVGDPAVTEKLPETHEHKEPHFSHHHAEAVVRLMGLDPAEHTDATHALHVVMNKNIEAGHITGDDVATMRRELKADGQVSEATAQKLQAMDLQTGLSEAQQTALTAMIAATQPGKEVDNGAAPNVTDPAALEQQKLQLRGAFAGVVQQSQQLQVEAGKVTRKSGLLAAGVGLVVAAAALLGMNKKTDWGKIAKSAGTVGAFVVGAAATAWVALKKMMTPLDAKAGELNAQAGQIVTAAQAFPGGAEAVLGDVISAYPPKQFAAGMVPAGSHVQAAKTSKAAAASAQRGA